MSRSISFARRYFNGILLFFSYTQSAKTIGSVRHNPEHGRVCLLFDGDLIDAEYPCHGFFDYSDQYQLVTL